MSGWIGVDFDGTLATHGSWTGPASLGEPIQPMVERVKKWIAEGKEVRIFTARVYPLMYVPVEYSPNWTPRTYEETTAKEALEAIREWCIKYFGQPLPVTCVKDYKMIELWDDRAVQVITNTGVALQEKLVA